VHLIATPLSFAVLSALAPQPSFDVDLQTRAGTTDLHSPQIEASIFSAMAARYRYGVTQMPCAAKNWEPERGWKPTREPSGKVRWVIGSPVKVIWAGIYGTCFIQSPLAQEQVAEAERIALECECNGWTHR